MSADGRTAQRAAAFNHLLEARRLLEEFIADPEYEEGSPEEFSLWDLENAIGMLMPDEDDDRAPPMLRIVGGA